MTVVDFNIEMGLYIFKFDSFETEFHSHPTIEIIIAEKGTFTLCTGNRTYDQLKFAIINANQKHKLLATNCELKLLMIEHHTSLVLDIFEPATITGSSIAIGVIAPVLPTWQIISFKTVSFC